MSCDDGSEVLGFVEVASSICVMCGVVLSLQRDPINRVANLGHLVAAGDLMIS